MVSNFRHQKIILVTDVHVIGHLGVVRSLGEAGYRIYAMSPKDDALGFHSRFVEKKFVCPTYAEPDFAVWFTAWLAANPVDVIVPSEGFLWVVQPIYDEISKCIPLKSDKDFVYKYINKFDHFGKILTSENETVVGNCPETLFVTQDSIPTAEQLGSLEFPVFIKIDGVYSFASDHDQIIKIESPSELPDTVQELLRHHEKFIIQGYVPGQKATASLIMKDGKVQASYVMRALHEQPYKGGETSLRETWAHDGMLNDAIVKAQCLDWNGPMMVEYRWDSETDRFYLIEYNLRFWAYMHLCLYAGIHFPVLLIDDFLGYKTDEQVVAAKQVLVRNLSFEVGHLLSYLKDSEVSKVSKAKVFLSFLRDSLSPFIYSDTFYPGDRKVWFYEVLQLVKNLCRRS